MHTDISFIKLTFENLDYVKVPARYFTDFELSDGGDSCAIAFTLNPEANADFDTFEADVHSIQLGYETLFDRLKRNDITHIGLDCGNGPEERFSVVWEDADLRGYRNRLQSVSVDCDGMLCVRIGDR